MNKKNIMGPPHGHSANGLNEKQGGLPVDLNGIIDAGSTAPFTPGATLDVEGKEFRRDLTGSCSTLIFRITFLILE